MVCWQTLDFFLRCIFTFCTNCAFVCGSAMTEDLEKKKCQPSKISKSSSKTTETMFVCFHEAGYNLSKYSQYFIDKYTNIHNIPLINIQTNT